MEEVVVGRVVEGREGANQVVDIAFRCRDEVGEGDRVLN